MPARTVKGTEFTIVVGDKRITVRHVYSKGKRCRVIAPPGVIVEARDRAKTITQDSGTAMNTEARKGE